MSAAPPVSIVMPVRDAEPFLAEALASLVAQTFADLEIVVVDDGSTDGSRERLEALAGDDPRVRVHAQEAQGVVAAANRALSLARGDLLVRMDADDVAHPQRVAALVDLAAAVPDAGLLASRVRIFPREAVGPGLARYEAWLNGLVSHEAIYRNRFVEYPLPNPSTALRRAALDALGPYRAGPFPEDYDLFLRAAAKGMRFAKHQDVLLDWREQPGRTTHVDPRYGLDRFRALKIEHIAPVLCGTARPLAIVGAGRDGKAWARGLRDAEGLSPIAYVDVHPGRIGQAIDGVPVHPYDDLDALAPAFFLVAVGRAGGRDEVRQSLVAAGLEEEADFLCVQ